MKTTLSPLKNEWEFYQKSLTLIQQSYDAMEKAAHLNERQLSSEQLAEFDKTLLGLFEEIKSASFSKTESDQLFSLITRQIIHLRKAQHPIEIARTEFLNNVAVIDESLQSNMEWSEAISSYQALSSLPESQRNQTLNIFSNIANCYLKIACSKTLTEWQRMKLAADVQLLLDFIFYPPFTQETLPSETRTQLLKTCHELVQLSQKPGGVFAYFAFKNYLPLFKKTNEEWFQLASDAFQIYFPVLAPQKASNNTTLTQFSHQTELRNCDESLKKEQEGECRDEEIADCFLAEAKIYYKELKNHPKNPLYILEKIDCSVEKTLSFKKKLKQSTLLKLLDLLTELNRFLSLCIINIKTDQEKTITTIFTKMQEFTDKHQYPSFFFLGVVDWLKLPASDALLEPFERGRRTIIQWGMKFLGLKQQIIDEDLLNNKSLSVKPVKKIIADLQTNILKLEHVKKELQRVARVRETDSVTLWINFNLHNSIKEYQETLAIVNTSIQTLRQLPQKYHPGIWDQFEQLEVLIPVIQLTIEKTKCGWVDDYTAYLKTSDEHKKRYENPYEGATPELALKFTQETWDFLQANHCFLDNNTCKHLYHTVLQHHIHFYAHSVPALDSKNADFLFNSVKNISALNLLTKYCTEEYLKYLAEIHRTNRSLYQIEKAPLNCLKDLHRRDLFLVQWTLARALVSNLSHTKGENLSYLKYLLTQISLHYDALVQLLPLSKQNSNTPGALMLELYTLLNVFYLRYNDSTAPIYLMMYKSFLKIAEKHIENYPNLFASLSDIRALLALIVEKQDEKNQKVLNTFNGRFWKVGTDQRRVAGNVYTPATSDRKPLLG